MSLVLEEAVLAVTGGARGIGAAVAEEARRGGARVAIGDVDAGLARRTARRIGALTVEHNVTSRQSWARFRAEVERELGPIDVLVNNAGIMRIGSFLDEPEEIIAQQLDINVLGMLLGCKAVLPGMLGRGQGHVINIASVAGRLAVSGAVTYSASKHAVIGLTRALQDELRETPVSVTAILPGLVNTELSRGLESNPFAPRVEPEQLAASVCAVVARPRGEVWVPGSGRITATIAGAIPCRVRNRITRLMGVDDPMLKADRDARAAYEARLVTRGDS